MVYLNKSLSKQTFERTIKCIFRTKLRYLMMSWIDEKQVASMKWNVANRK